MRAIDTNVLVRLIPLGTFDRRLGSLEGSQKL